ncbi:MAG: hypothetical protein QXG02_01865 [Candidatus Anstonellales archaeon]
MSLFFGTSGARGIYGKEITQDFVFQVANAFADEKTKVYIGMDRRESSPILHRAAVSGALSAGADVYSLGFVPTPVVSFYSRKNKTKGIMITASHNPPEYNGIKIFEDGMELTKEKANEFLNKKVKKKNGRFFRMDAHEYFDFVLSKAKKYDGVVGVDGNGVASLLTPRILSMMGVRVFGANCFGGFNRNPEPNEENLKYLKAFGKKIFFAHDGDGDRVMVFYDGKIISGDILLGMIVEEVLRDKKGIIVTTVEAGLCVREAVERMGGKIEITNVGSAYVGERVMEKNALFGGEPAGEFIFPEISLCPDGIFATVFLLNMDKREKLWKRMKRFKHYPIVRKKFKVENKEAVMEKVKNEMDVEGKRSETDGIRIDGEDYWVLVRPSGTEPVVRLTVEAKEKSKCEELAKKVEKLIL